QAEDGIRDWSVTGVQTCALPICATAAAGGPTATPAATETAKPTEPPTATPQPEAALKQQDGIIGRLFDAYQQEILKLDPSAKAQIGRASCRERGEITEDTGA